MEFRKGVTDVTVLIVDLVIMAEPSPHAATVMCPRMSFSLWSTTLYAVYVQDDPNAD